MAGEFEKLFADNFVVGRPKSRQFPGRVLGAEFGAIGGAT
jgi:hypothetical protein